MDAVAAAVPQIDPTLEGAVKSTLGQDAARTADAAQQGRSRRPSGATRRCAGSSSSAGVSASPTAIRRNAKSACVWFLNRYGPALVDRLLIEGCRSTWAITGCWRSDARSGLADSGDGEASTRGWRIRVRRRGCLDAGALRLHRSPRSRAAVVGRRRASTTTTASSRASSKRGCTASAMRVIPRVFARPLSRCRPARALSDAELVARLNDVGYTAAARVERPGEFALDAARGRSSCRAAAITPGRSGATMTFAEARPVPSRRRPAGPGAGPHRPPRCRRAGRCDDVVARSAAADGADDRVAREAPPRAARRTSRRACSRRCWRSRTGASTATRASIRSASSARCSPTCSATRRYLVGAQHHHAAAGAQCSSSPTRSTPSCSRGQRSYGRKMLEQFMSLILETKATKDEILELYLNDVYLGNRGSFALHGVAEAARIFFGKDVSNLTLSEAALIAGVIQNRRISTRRSRIVERAKERRNMVLRAMADAGYITAEAAERARPAIRSRSSRARVDNEAPYFVDYVGERARQASSPASTQRAGPLDIYTTLDLNLQRYAQDAVRDGLANVDQMLARSGGASAVRRRRRWSRSIRAPARSWRWSAAAPTTSRSSIAPPRRAGSPARPSSRSSTSPRSSRRPTKGATDITPATLVLDEPTTWSYRQAGVVAAELRRRVRRRDHAAPRAGAVAQHRHDQGRRADRLRPGRGAVEAGQGRQDADLRGYPSIALGVFELTPLEVAKAYTVFANGGTSCRSPRGDRRVVSGDESLQPAPAQGPRVAREPATAFLVTNMMRSVLNEGTGAGARGNGFTARRRRQDRHHQRSARCLVRRLHARSCWPWSGSASTTTSRSA